MTATLETRIATQLLATSIVSSPDALFVGRRGARAFALALRISETAVIATRQFMIFRRELKVATRPVRRTGLQVA